MANHRYPGGNELLDAEYLLKEVLELSYNASVADLGCGSMAFFTLQAAKLVGDQGRVYACDIQKEVLSSAEGKARQEGLLNIKTVWTNLEIFGATKIMESLDYVLLVNTLFQTKKHKEVLKEAYRLLKAQGKMLFVEWKAASGPVGPAKELRLQRQTVEELAREVGFIKLKDFEAGQYHYGVIFQK